MTSKESFLSSVAAEAATNAASTSKHNLTITHDNNQDDADDEDLEQATNATHETPSTSAGEMRAVLVLRVALIAVWAVATLLASLGVFLYTSHAEESEFRQKYTDYAAKVLDAFQDNLEQSLYMVDLLSVTYTSYALDWNLTWPFVTLPHFEIIGARARHLVQNQGGIAFSPVVSRANRKAWEAYSVANQGWAQEAIHYYETHPEFNNEYVWRVNGSDTITPLLWKINDNNIPSLDDTPGPALPVWQFDPIGKTPFQVNLNVMSQKYLVSSLVAATVRGDAILSKFLTLGQDLTAGPTNSPVNTMIYPVFRDFDNSKPRKVVGVIGRELDWKSFLRKLLPKNSNGITAVLANTCGQVYTFEVIGENSTYIGQGDLHDKKFDGMMEEIQLSAIQVPGLVRVNSLGCPVSLRLYPSASFHRAYITNKPRIYTAAAASMFLFTAIFFLMYDWIVNADIAC